MRSIHRKIHLNIFFFQPDDSKVDSDNGGNFNKCNLNKSAIHTSVVASKMILITHLLTSITIACSMYAVHQNDNEQHRQIWYQLVPFYNKCDFYFFFRASRIIQIHIHPCFSTRHLRQMKTIAASTISVRLFFRLYIFIFCMLLI
jgi:hypothetical protein